MLSLILLLLHIKLLCSFIHRVFDTFVIVVLKMITFVVLAIEVLAFFILFIFLCFSCAFASSYLPRKDIQVLVQLGCPSTDRKVVNSGKRLRAHVGIDEGNVCKIYVNNFLGNNNYM